MSADKQIKAAVLFYVDEGVSDDALIFMDAWLPDELDARIKAISEQTITDIYFSVPSSYTGRLLQNPNCAARTGEDDVSFWKTLFAKTDADHIVKIFCDSPFLDGQLIKEMLQTQAEYFAEFTYSENLPSGFSCEIVSRSLADSLPATEEKTLPLTQVVKANINKFDVELFYKAPDIRTNRINFRSKDLRDKKIMEALAGIAKGVPAYEQTAAIISEHPEALYIAPSYVELELTGECSLNCIFCPRKAANLRDDMQPSLFDKILRDMQAFSLPYTICLGGMGEPLAHADALNIIQTAIEDKLVERLIVETNGINITDEYIKLAADGKLVTIVNINGIDAGTYKTLHGEDRFAKVTENIFNLKQALGDTSSRLYVQIMKINETESFLDSYYDFWESKKIPIILQKQNTWLGLTEDRRYSDLTPLERTSCWHLQRDLFILANGDVAFCKQDIQGLCTAGSLVSKTLAEIYASKLDDFIRNTKADYPAKPNCAVCDEWYTFNF